MNDSPQYGTPPPLSDLPRGVREEIRGLVGLPRARQIITKIEEAPRDVPTLHAMAEHAQAVAAVSAAESARLLALCAVGGSEVFSDAELGIIATEIRHLVGFPRLRDDEVRKI